MHTCVCIDIKWLMDFHDTRWRLLFCLIKKYANYAHMCMYTNLMSKLNSYSNFVHEGL